MVRAAGRLVLGVLGGLVVATAALSAEPVENFPSRPIHIVLPFTPGGGTDVIARKLAPGMQSLAFLNREVEGRDGCRGVAFHCIPERQIRQHTVAQFVELIDAHCQAQRQIP